MPADLNIGLTNIQTQNALTKANKLLGVDTNGNITLSSSINAADNQALSVRQANSLYSAVGHSHSAEDITSGILPAARGGTGTTSLSNAANNLINALTTENSIPQDDDYYVSQYVAGGSTTKTYHRRPVKKLWEYIKSKADSEYLNTSGDIMTGDLTLNGGDLTFPRDKGTLAFRTEDTNYLSHIYHSTPGNEALVFANANTTTSWIFANINGSSRPSWENLSSNVSALQIKNKKVVINKFIPSGQDASYNLDVNGSANATTMTIDDKVTITYDSVNNCLNFNF